jgi:hypothetical protein
VIFLSLLLVLVVALACASFFRNMLAAFVVFLALPVAVLLHALIGTLLAVFALATLAIAVALLQTISDTLALLRGAGTRRARTPQTRPQPRARERSERGRIAA